MPVSFVPLYTAVLLLLPPILGRVLRRRRGFWCGLVVSIVAYLYILLVFHFPGWQLRSKAHEGDAASQYNYARWIENHDGNLSALVIWFGRPDLLAGYGWLEKAAEQDYAPAVYLVGLRLKYGDFVPRPPEWPEWREPMGNIFCQPDRGQALIDRALRLGFQPPPGDERSYYIRVFRRGET